MKFSAVFALVAPLLATAAPTDLEVEGLTDVNKRCTTRQEVDSVWHESGLSRRRVRAWADGADHMQFCDIWNTKCGQSRGILINCQCWESDESPTHAIVDVSTALGPAGDNTFNNAYDFHFRLFTGRLGCSAA